MTEENRLAQWTYDFWVANPEVPIETRLVVDIATQGDDTPNVLREPPVASERHCTHRKDNVMRMHRCNFLGCRQLVPMGEKFCKEHAEQNRADRDKYMNDYKEGIKGSLKERHDNSVANRKYNELSRSTEAIKFYGGTRWTKTANHVRVRESYTSGVSGKILNDGDIQIDHIIKRDLLPKEQWYDTINLWLLSRREHQLKTSIERKMLREGKADVLRHLGKDWWAKVLRERLYGG